MTEERRGNLAQLKIGQSARIVSLEALPPGSRQKLLDLGLTRDEVVTIIHKAPLGDPLWLALKGYELSFRRELAELIEVEPLRKGAYAKVQKEQKQ